MMKFFSIESTFMRGLIRVTDIFILNVLFILTSFPIFTIGAATTALNTSWRRILNGKDNDIIKNYFHYFKVNFRQSTIIWLGQIILGLIYSLEAVFFLGQTGVLKWIGLLTLLFFVTLWLIVTLVGLTYIGIYQDSIVQALKNSIALALNRPVYCILLIWTNVLVAHLATSSLLGLATSLYVFTFGGFSMLSAVNTYLVKRIINIK